jgi:hypothetical protein
MCLSALYLEEDIAELRTMLALPTYKLVRTSPYSLGGPEGVFSETHMQAPALDRP